METQTQTHRMGLNPFLMFYIDAMLNFDGDIDANVKCEHTIKVCSHGAIATAILFYRNKWVVYILM